MCDKCKTEIRPTLTPEEPSASAEPAAPTSDCRACGSEFKPSKLLSENGDKYCIDCHRERNTCVNCDDFAPTDAGITEHNGDFYCETCSSDELGFCSVCEEYHRNDDIRTVQEISYPSGSRRIVTSYVCVRCADRNYAVCAACVDDIYFNRDNAYLGPDDEYYCEDHAEFSTCSACGEITWNDDLQYNENDDDGYCSACFESERYQIIDSRTFDKNPHKRHVGFELEFLQPAEVNIDVDSYGLLHGDGSVSGSEGRGQELSTHAYNGDKLFEVIDAIGEKLKGCKVNKTCGFHVHINMKNLEPNRRMNVYRAFRAFEHIFFGIVAPSRTANNYCRRIGNEIEPSHDRYRTLNLEAFHEHGTFEYRIHQGTVNPIRIKNWIRLLLDFTKTFKNIEMDETRIQEIRNMTDRKKLTLFFQMIKTPLSIKKYIIQRIKTFNNISIPSHKRAIFKTEQAKRYYETMRATNAPYVPFSARHAANLGASQINAIGERIMSETFHPESENE